MEVRPHRQVPVVRQAPSCSEHQLATIYLRHPLGKWIRGQRFQKLVEERRSGMLCQHVLSSSVACESPVVPVAVGSKSRRRGLILWSYARPGSGS